MVKEWSKAVKEADPSKFSWREEALDFERAPGETNVFIDKSTGERFHRLHGSLVERQKLLALLLKRVINVSDVVKVGDSYYSHEQNFENLQPVSGDVEHEVKADRFLLSAVFGDADHYYDNSSLPDGWYINNLIVNKKDRKVNFFDFGESWFDWIRDEKRGVNPKFAAAFYTGSLILEGLMDRYTKNGIVYFRVGTQKRSIDILKRKTKLLAEFFTDNQFDSFKAVVKRSGVKMTEAEQKELFSIIQTRLNLLRTTLESLKY